MILKIFSYFQYYYYCIVTKDEWLSCISPKDKLKHLPRTTIFNIHSTLLSFNSELSPMCDLNDVCSIVQVVNISSATTTTTTIKSLAHRIYDIIIIINNINLDVCVFDWLHHLRHHPYKYSHLVDQISFSVALSILKIINIITFYKYIVAQSLL